jgi:GNAT superfamily N-acetyltransferase
MMNLFVRNLQYHEMPYLIDLAAKEGWNPGLSDADFFFKIDPNAHLAIFEDKQPVGFITAVNFNNFGFLGFHIVKPEFRNRGIGTHLLKTALQKLGEINLGLNCFPHQEKYYEKFGFKSAHKIFTFKGITDGTISQTENIVCPFFYPFKYIETYDNKCFPSSRSTFLSYYLNQPKSLLTAKLDNERFSGIGLFRPCLDGHKISPLYADNIQIAEELLLNLTGCLPKGTTYYLDICEKNEDALLLAGKYKLEKINEAIRMYNSTIPEISLQNIYSFASFELG